MQQFYLSYKEALNKLESIGQKHLLDFWQKISEEQKQLLLKQIEILDIEFFHLQKKLLQTPQKEPLKAVYERFTDYHSSGSEENKFHGQQMLAEGKVGCLVVAGGQGTRLGSKEPKGMFPISPRTGKTLFQLLAESTLKMGKKVNRLPPLAIMTSPQNHVQTVNFFNQHGNFGLAEEQLYFFSQAMLPMLNAKGDLFLEQPHVIATGPDGNGSAFECFVKQGLFDAWDRQGIQYVNFILVDNPLADPFDEELVGFHDKTQAEATIKCIQRESATESVGLVVQSQKKVQIVEYSDLSDSERTATLADGSLKHSIANISLFCFSMSFIKKMADSVELPWHLAYKSCSQIDLVEGMPKKTKTKAWKFEKFIFDFLPYAKKVTALLFPRECCFAPLKSISGEGSISSVQEALLKRGIL